MAHRQGTSWLRIAGLFTLSATAALLLGTNAVSAPHAHDSQELDYRGAATLFVVSVGLDPDRCGDAPSFEITFEGSGIDTAGGITTIESSACQNTATGEVFDLVAVDTYADGDSLNIVSDSFFLVFDPETCVSTNVHPVHFSLDGGTGAWEGASGGGRYDIALNDPNCNGEVTPAFVWFGGRVL
jgi:hypothetical protein